MAVPRRKEQGMFVQQIHGRPRYCKFKDVAGMDEAKEGIMEFVKFLTAYVRKTGSKDPLWCYPFLSPGRRLGLTTLYAHVAQPHERVRMSDFAHIVGFGSSYL